jgi:hypothetical protein
VVKVTVPEGDVECTAAPINCKDGKYPADANEDQMKALCAEPSGAIFETAMICTGPPNPKDAQCDVEAIQLIYAAAFEVNRIDMRLCARRQVVTADHAGRTGCGSL